MEQEQEVVETPVVENNDVASHQHQDTSAAPVAQAAGAEGEEAQPAYEPNYKFKVYDEEKEMDDFIRAAIKDQDTEKKARELYEKAYGLDAVKGKLDKYRTDYQGLDTKHKSLESGINQLRTHIQNGDFDAFFKDTNVPMEVVWKWVQDKINYQGLSQEQKKAYDDNVRLRRETSEASQTSNTLQDRIFQLEVNSLDKELNWELSKPEISELAKAVDSRSGAGSFRNLVLEIGQAAKAGEGGQYISPAEAIQKAMKYLGPVSQPAAQATPGTPQTRVVQSGNTKPVIPNIKGRSTSPVKKGYKSIDEMRKDFKEKLAAKAAN